ncbi:hypothetical protein CHS0354_013612 [Potamilus streckersoni]|uniref:TNF receptor-associated factor n=1 Tax=Potamilus streckersoni TaxID=2493646 RepID=A0AAE0VYK0_9BIVA|nr:hypothetical protein CHS0354_013612 [Potamilus streckersoni]
MAEPADIDGGYSVSLIVQKDFDKKFLCSLCGKVLREPIQSFCGHRFCKGCIDKVLKSEQQMKCPQCQQEGIGEEEYSVLRGDQMYPDNAVKREMSRIKVQCLNTGCSWQGLFKDYEDHASQCQFQLSQCPQCGFSVSHFELEEHKTKTCPKRPVICKHCGQPSTNAELSEHSKVCPKHPLKCEQCKTKKIPRDRLKDHQDNECPNRKWTCPADGQLVEGSRFQKHVEESAGNHLVFAMRQGDNINQRVAQLEERINTLSGSETLLLARQLQSTADKVNQIEQIVGNLASRPMSDPITHSGIQGQHVASGEIQMRVRQLEVKTDTFEGIVTTLHRDIEQCITTLETIDRQRKVDKEMIESNERKIRSLERTLALKDMTIMDLEARIQSLEYASYDGILLWRIPEFSKHRLEAQRGKTLSIYSPAFYTSRTGYKMCIRLYPNGDGMGKGSHMSIFFVLMRGPYDALLSWPFMQRVTFMLIDQNNREHVIDSFRPDPASSSFKRPTSDMNIASGCPLFIPHKRLDDASYGYIKEDSMFIKTVVDIANLTPLNDNKKLPDVSSTKKHSG